MTESETHPEVFQAIMAYIHLGEVKTFPENWLTSSLAGEMLAFCHRALIMDLKRRVLDEMKSKLNAANAAYVYVALSKLGEEPGS